MYGAPSERLHTVPTVKPPPVSEKPPETVYNEVCTVDFNAAPTNVQRKPTIAVAQVNEGDGKLIASSKAMTDQARADLVISGIAHYRDALLADPYDPEATLQLARAYDVALHKGCALALLKRLAALEQNPKFKPQAARRINNVVYNPQWFRDYRKAALDAVNR